jgi:hypothetical protein
MGCVDSRVIPAKVTSVTFYRFDSQFRLFFLCVFRASQLVVAPVASCRSDENGNVGEQVDDFFWTTGFAVSSLVSIFFLSVAMLSDTRIHARIWLDDVPVPNRLLPSSSFM